MSVTATLAQVLPATSGGLLDVDQVAERLHCSARHVYRLADAGLMPRPVKLGSLCRWPESTGNPTTGIDDWIKAGCPTCRHVAAKAGGK